jgi:hypothetical protein
VQCNYIAQATGDYDLPKNSIQKYIDFCQQNNLLLFFDLQLGAEPVQHAFTAPHNQTPGQNTPPLSLVDYLIKYPFVEVALDTEFHAPNTPAGIAAVEQYPNFTGHLGASEINWAINEMAQLPQKYHIPRKVLVVNQFLPGIISDDQGVTDDKNQVQPNPGVSLAWQADGFGGVSDKVARYQEFVQQDMIEYGGYKLFYYYPDGSAVDYDENGIAQPQKPAAVISELFPQPLFLSYE